MSMIKYAYDKLENYVKAHLHDWHNKSDHDNYDLEMQRTRDKLENIIYNEPYLSPEDRSFLMELCEDDIDEDIIGAINCILGKDIRSNI